MSSAILIKKISLSGTIVMTVCFALFLTSAGCMFSDVVKNGSPEEIYSAVKKGADVNEISGSGETPLLCAIRYNRKPYEASLILVNSGSDINRPDNNGYTPLHCAVQTTDSNDALRIAELLLEHEANVNARGGFDNSTPLMNAVSRSDGLKIVELLIKYGADLRIPDSRNESALHYAASANGAGDIITLLIKHGADVNSGAPSYSPLHRASYSGAAENIKILLAHNALINIKGAASESKTPLETAVDAKHFDCAKILIENGADINTESYYNYQPFKYRNNSQTYLNKLTHVDLDTIQFERMTPLHRAVTHNSFSFVEYLLIKGAKTGKDAHFGGYALDFAFFLNYYDIAELLIKYKAPSLFADIYLNDAVEEKNLKKVELLLRAGADVKHKNFTGDTSLHLASKNGDIEMVKLLLKHKADISTKGSNGKTPADIAADDEIRKLLKP